MASSSEREEREKAFLELQEKYHSQIDVLRRVTQQERATVNTKQRIELMMTELKAVPETTPTYRQIGKAYFLEPRASILSDGDQSVASAGVEIESLKQKKAVIEQKLRETQQELQEMVKA